MTRRRVIVSVVLMLLAGLAYYFYAGSATPAGQPPLMRLDTANFGELREAFNGAKDSVRVIALLSPT